MSCPIPFAVLKRRPGVPVAYRMRHGYFTSGWPNNGSSSMSLYEVRYRAGRGKPIYWVHHYAEWDSKRREVKNTWETFTPKTLPSRLTGLSMQDFPWQEIP